jgi:hypothetical protein
MMGVDSEKIELRSFVSICKKYGLVKLVSGGSSGGGSSSSSSSLAYARNTA